MLTATFLAIFFIPLFYVFVVRVFGRKKAGGAAAAGRAHASASLLSAALFLGGCSMAPEYVRPPSPVPPAWPATRRSRRCAARAGGPVAGATSPTRASAPSSSRRSPTTATCAIATLNIERAQAFYRIQRAELFPSVGAGANVSTQRIPEEVGARRGGVHLDAVHGGARRLWLGARSVRPHPQPEGVGPRAVPRDRAGRPWRRRLSLVAAVAQAYLTRAADAENLQLAQATLETQQSSLDLIQKSRDLGVASDLELNQIRSQVEAARADVARFTGLVAVDLNALQVLVGRAGQPRPAAGEPGGP